MMLKKMKMRVNWETTGRNLSQENEYVVDDEEELFNDNRKKRQFAEEREPPNEKGDEQNVLKEITLESMPEEVLDIIVNFSMTGHDRKVVDTFSALRNTNRKFKRLVSRFITRLPTVSCNRNTSPGLNSMRKILKEVGSGSGLVLDLKEIIRSNQWANAWVNLLFTGVGTWMYIVAIIWKSGKKHWFVWIV